MGVATGVGSFVAAGDAVASRVGVGDAGSCIWVGVGVAARTVGAAELRAEVDFARGVVAGDDAGAVGAPPPVLHALRATHATRSRTWDNRDINHHSSSHALQVEGRESDLVLSAPED